jgi:hypothetical protein
MAVELRAHGVAACLRLLACLALASGCLAGPGTAQDDLRFTIARLQYDGGGDWYSNPSSLPNLLEFVGRETGIAVRDKEATVRIDDEELFAYPVIYMTGHGNVAFSTAQAARLRLFLESGGFLHADDNYGMDESFRREMARVFPEHELVELPPGHELFRCHFALPGGLPKIHEHDGQRPQALGLFVQGRLAVLYTYEADLGDGWEDAQVHGDPPAKRRAALEMGANIVVWALTH